MALPVGITAWPIHVDDAPGAATPLIVPASVPEFEPVSPAAVVKLEVRLGSEPEVDSGVWRLPWESTPSVLSTAAGAGWTMVATKQLKRTPAMEVESALLPVAPFARDDTLGVTEDPSGAESGMFSIARPRVAANVSPPVGVPSRRVDTGGVGAATSADWTGRVSIESPAAQSTAINQEAWTPPNAPLIVGNTSKARKPLRTKVFGV